MMFNSRNLGALIVDQEPHVNEWEEPQFGIRNIGIEEKYGFGVLNEGLSRSQSPSLSLSRPRDADTAGARLSRGLGTLEAAALRGWVGLFTAGCRHRQVLGHLAALATLGTLVGANSVSSSPASALVPGLSR